MYDQFINYIEINPPGTSYLKINLFEKIINQLICIETKYNLKEKSFYLEYFLNLSIKELEILKKIFKKDPDEFFNCFFISHNQEKDFEKLKDFIKKLPELSESQLEILNKFEPITLIKIIKKFNIFNYKSLLDFSPENLKTLFAKKQRSYIY